VLRRIGVFSHHRQPLLAGVIMQRPPLGIDAQIMAIL
jgi:hypothetical protein